MKWVLTVGLLSMLASTSGCDGNPCRDVLLDMCEKGCECSNNGSCNVRLAEGSTVSGTTAQACVDTLVQLDDACGDDDDTDYDACLDDLEGAECDSSGFGVLVAPASCEPSG